MPDRFEAIIKTQRTALRAFCEEVLAIKSAVQDKQFEAREGEDVSEEIANLTLAYRHIEDARMRLGKVLQARAGGESIYDK